MPSEMSPRERVLTAMRREKPDRVPKQAGFTPAVQEEFERRTGATNPAEYFGFENRGVGFRAPENLPDFSRWYPGGIPAEASISEYGTGQVPGDYYHFTRKIYPLEHTQTVEELEEYPWPDFTPPERHEHLEAAVADLHAEEWFVAGSVGHIWESAWQMPRMERLMEAMVLDPPYAAYIFDQITEDRAFMAMRYGQAGCDMIHCGDDIGMQDRLMMSPAMWREWLKPRWRKVIKAAKDENPEILAWYHSDGDVRDVIEDLIEIGFDILNPVQPECMDPAELKRVYGDRLAFWGCIGTQTTMPFGTPDDVREAVRWTIENVGYDGGLLIAPTHVLEPDVPWENIEALFEAVETYGVYED
ncbi:MAG: uroporphyrinogen decarboxylase family protein [Armatimonadota bacterium]|jgi:uroporphyrinogen decarboxylase